MDDFWEKNADNWAALLASGKLASRKITNGAIAGAVIASGASSILDIGCGEGFLAEQIPGIEYDGIDGSSALIAIAKEKSVGHFSRVSYDEMCQGLWHPRKKYDALVYNFSLLASDLTPLLNASRTFLSDRGQIFIQTLHPCFSPAPYSDGWRTEDFSGFPVPFLGSMPWYQRTLRSWVSLFSAAQLGIVEIQEPAPAEGTPHSILFILRPV